MSPNQISVPSASKMQALNRTSWPGPALVAEENPAAGHQNIRLLNLLARLGGQELERSRRGQSAIRRLISP